MKEKLKEIFKAIENERKYQDELFGDPGAEGQHSVTEFLVYIRDYTEEAIHVVCRTVDPGYNDTALHIVRKIAALCVACMEQNGIRERDMKDLAKCCELHGICTEEE